jgi:hypothetical protein
MPSKIRTDLLRQYQKEYFAKNKERFREMNNTSARECMRNKAVFKKMCLMYERLNEDATNFVGRPKKVQVVSFQFV